MPEEIEFLFSGVRRKLTRNQVIAAMRSQIPGPIQTYAVAIEGRRFPVKQVLASALQVPRSEFISTRAQDLLRRLGFDVINVEQGRLSVTDPGVRQAALSAAAQFAAGRELEERDVLAIAERFAQWLEEGNTLEVTTTSAASAERDASDDSVRNSLIETARAGRLIFYSELAALVGIDTNNPYFGAQLGKILGRISENEVADGRPMLSAIVVSKDTRLPGKGFYDLGKQLRQTESGEDEMSFSVRQIKLVHDYWRDTRELTHGKPGEPM